MNFGSLYALAYAYLYHVVQMWSKLKSILGIVSNSNKVQTVFLFVVLNVKPHLTLRVVLHVEHEKW